MEGKFENEDVDQIATNQILATPETREGSETDETNEATETENVETDEELEADKGLEDEADEDYDELDDDFDDLASEDSDNVDGSQESGEDEGSYDELQDDFDEDTENTEKTSLFDKVKNLFSKGDAPEKDFVQSEDTDMENEVSDESQQEQSRKSWELSPEDLDKFRDAEQEIAEKARNGEYDKPSSSFETDDAIGEEHGEDGERTPWSDAQWAREHNFE